MLTTSRANTVMVWSAKREESGILALGENQTVGQGNLEPVVGNLVAVVLDDRTLCGTQPWEAKKRSTVNLLSFK